MLFQHHLPPPVSTYTSGKLCCFKSGTRTTPKPIQTNTVSLVDAPAQAAEAHQPDPAQLIDTYVAPAIIEPNYIIGSKPGVSGNYAIAKCQVES